jgi:hypothetical protein
MYDKDRDGNVVITLTTARFDELLISLGYAIGCATVRDAWGLGEMMVELANEINSGNPNWTPYKVRDKGKD